MTTKHPDTAAPLLAGRVENRARIFDEELGKALVAQARAVARLQGRRRKLRADLRKVDHELRTAKRFLVALTREKRGTTDEGK
jgi:hypothetical protein